MFHLYRHLWHKLNKEHNSNKLTFCKRANKWRSFTIFTNFLQDFFERTFFPNLRWKTYTLHFGIRVGNLNSMNLRHVVGVLNSLYEALVTQITRYRSVTWSQQTTNYQVLWMARTNFSPSKCFYFNNNNQNQRAFSDSVGLSFHTGGWHSRKTRNPSAKGWVSPVLLLSKRPQEILLYEKTSWPSCTVQVPVLEQDFFLDNYPRTWVYHLVVAQGTFVSEAVSTNVAVERLFAHVDSHVNLQSAFCRAAVKMKRRIHLPFLWGGWFSRQ